MLIVRNEQLQALGQASASTFERALVEQACRFAPRLHALRGDAAMRRLVQTGVERARAHGFDHRGPVRFWVEMMLACGSGWHDDPQFATVGQALARSDLQQNFRADLVYETWCEHSLRVDGPGKVFARAALQRIADADWAAVLQPAADPEAAALAALQQLHPQKFAAVDAAALRQTVIAAGAHCRRLGIDVAEGQVLLSGLMFGFGHDVLEDPLYPWVAATLQPGRGADAALRCRRLARKTRVYVRAVLTHWSA